MKLNFKTNYFWLEVEVTNAEEGFKAIQDAKDMIEYAETIEFPIEVSKPTASKESAPFNPDPPSEKQISIMSKFGIKYDDMTTREEASALIQESMRRSKT